MWPFAPFVPTCAAIRGGRNPVQEDAQADRPNRRRWRVYQPVWRLGAKSFLGLEIGDADLLKSCQPVPFSAIHGERPMNAMAGERSRSQKTERAFAIANGTSVAAGARRNEVPKRTA
jgi:hypothetical protein